MIEVCKPCVVYREVCNNQDLCEKNARHQHIFHWHGSKVAHERLQSIGVFEADSGSLETPVRQMFHERKQSSQRLGFDLIGLRKETHAKRVIKLRLSTDLDCSAQVGQLCLQSGNNHGHLRRHPQQCLFSAPVLWQQPNTERHQRGKARAGCGCPSSCFRSPKFWDPEHRDSYTASYTNTKRGKKPRTRHMPPQASKCPSHVPLHESIPEHILP